MSYSEYLNRQKITSPKVIDTSMRLPDASSYTWRKKMASNIASGQSYNRKHAINNVADPSVTPNFYTKEPITGFSYAGGRVKDASDYTLGLSAASIGQDRFDGGKIYRNVYGTSDCQLTYPPASQVVNQNGNIQGDTSGLNMGYVSTCTSEFQPQSKSYFVDTIPDIKLHKIGVSPAVGPAKGTQLPITTCTDTNTHGVPKGQTKDEVSLNLHPAGPIKQDFLTAILGPQVSQNGAYGRAPKVGRALRNIPYVEKHHGLASQPVPHYEGFHPPNSAPPQLLLNGRRK